MEKIKIQWVTEEHNIVGNAFGYNHHNRMMRKYSGDFFEFTDDAPVAVHIVPADKFKPVPGKFNILFTMWEALDLPDSYKQNLKLADAVITPCRFCKDLFQKHVRPGVPLEVCWEGVEEHRFPFFQRKFPNLATGEKFRYLWVGAPNPRKGYGVVLEAVKIAEQIPNLEIYIKTTVNHISRLDSIKLIFKHWKRITNLKGVTEGGKPISGWDILKRVFARMPRPSLANKVRVYGRFKNIIMDTRVLPFDDLIKLYNSAHAFVLPSFGEGWGLTLCEAMATGAPCIAPCNTGTADFFDEQVGYVIKHSVIETDFVNYKLKSRVYMPDTESMVRKMIEVFENYDEALRRGKKAHSRIHSRFTWTLSGKRLAEIVRKAVPHDRIAVGV